MIATGETIEVGALNTRAAKDLEGKSFEITSQASKLSIRTQGDYETAAGLRAAMKKMLSEADATRKSITSPLDQAKKAVMDLFRPIETKLDNGIRHVDSLLVDYTDKQEKIRREAEEKLRKEAEEKERKERERLEERAKKAADKGNEEKAEELWQKAAEVQVVAPTLAPTYQKAPGLSYREDWSAEVVDLMALVKAVAAGKAPVNFLTANTTVLNAQARATKNSLSFDGVKFVSRKVPVGR